MGALSSWPVMAISHHVLIWWSSQLAYPDRDFDPSSEYAILGDDLVIANSAIAEKYLELIKLLGVDFSPEKTIIREGLAEFAKSLFRRGEDLSPFPSAPLIFDINTVVSNVLAVLTTCSDRKFRTDLSTIMGLYP